MQGNAKVEELHNCVHYVWGYVQNKLKGGLRLFIAMYMEESLYADCFFSLKMDC